MHGPLREDEHIANHEFMKEEFVAGIHEPHVQCPFQYEDRLTGSWMGMGRYRRSGSHVYARHVTWSCKNDAESQGIAFRRTDVLLLILIWINIMYIWYC